ncbi:uncharacterized protein LOC131929027 [Physella acuta]|uniref:uncharacterized protein LOC131929027 n=1 Tax=Physella acuta TaxID=109671 RepID=UPI0027DB3E47|nr:uncharacterized protein LOC131929027 [Physella acuta]
MKVPRSQSTTGSSVDLEESDISVRIQNLDETEVVVKIADWVKRGSGCLCCEQDGAKLRATPSELIDIFRISFNEQIQSRYLQKSCANKEKPARQDAELGSVSSEQSSSRPSYSLD